MTQKELDAAFASARSAVNAMSYMGQNVGSYIKDADLRNIVQDALQAAEDVRRGGHKEGKGV